MSFVMVPDRNDKGHPEEWPVPGNEFDQRRSERMELYKQELTD
jgi:hypothetical protein